MKGAMKISPRDMVLSLIGYGTAREEEIGRTSLQKVAYFASVRTGIPLGHRAFYYGPYSSKVEEETEALVLSGLVNQTVTDLGFVNKKGFPGVRYSYTLTDTGNQRLETLEDFAPDVLAAIRDTVDRLDDTVGSLDQGLLSLAAKTYFIADEQGRELSVAQIQELAKQKNWVISKTQVEKVANYLQELGLVNVTEN